MFCQPAAIARLTIDRVDDPSKVILDLDCSACNLTLFPDAVGREDQCFPKLARR